MKINPNIEKIIKNYIQNYLISHGNSTVRELLDNYSGPISISEAELRNTVYKALKEGYLEVISEGNSNDLSEIHQLKPFSILKENESISIVVSKPRLHELGLSTIQYRNEQIDTIDCFRKIIESSRKMLRICSPFLQSDVLDKDSFPELKDLLANAFDRGVKIQILSRELFQRRGSEIVWIRDIARELGREDNLVIADYHSLSNDGRILSSTHAKLLIADYNLAYVGSAELRKNSLIANFEVGCLISGPQVIGICEVFDSMFSRGKIWK